jgi:hypothetical protein
VDVGADALPELLALPDGLMATLQLDVETALVKALAPRDVPSGVRYS